MRSPWFTCIVAAVLSFGCSVPTGAADETALTARVIATGIPGAGAVSAVGVFHAGGPIHDNAAFAAYTLTGRVLDPNRVLVTSSSNFGIPAIAGMPEGSVLSIDPTGEPMHIASSFAQVGGQTSDAPGRVQLFTAASATFLNGVNTPKAVTANLPAVSNPMGISINNAFGRLWFPSAPSGIGGPGFESIIDPTGVPLASAPDHMSGGVFSETKTNRQPQQLHAGAMTTALVANALLGQSPDGSKRAVFAVLAADGSITQAHTEFGVDGLAPAGTITPQTGRARRAGMIFNWVPDRILYVTDAARNAIVAIPIGDDTKIFTASTPRLMQNAALHRPIDLAPAVHEIANGVFSSNTSLAGNSDLYVLNDDGTIVRMRQDGSVVAVRHVVVGGVTLGSGRMSGIATSSDAAHIYLTVRDAKASGTLVELAAFGAAVADAGSAPSVVAAGEAAFHRSFTPESGLGPLFNERSCVACHATPSAGGVGQHGLSVVTRIARVDTTFDALDRRGGPVARSHSVRELGFACPLRAGVPAVANATSIRNALPLYDDGAIDAVADDAIRAGAIEYADGVHGRPNLITIDGKPRVGRFGWKADVVELKSFVAEAFVNELGITNPIFRHERLASSATKLCAGEHVALEDDGTLVNTVTAFITSLRAPAHGVDSSVSAGASQFAALGCEECHATRIKAGDAALYSDLLLHNMGAALDDGFQQGSASGADWRTMPLHGIASRRRFLHDARASTIADAIVAHDGEAASATRRFRALDPAARASVTAFINSL